MILENSSSDGGNEWSAWFTNISGGEMMLSIRFKHLRYNRNPVDIFSDCNFRPRFLSYLTNKRATNEKTKKKTFFRRKLLMTSEGCTLYNTVS